MLNLKVILILPTSSSELFLDSDVLTGRQLNKTFA